MRNLLLLVCLVVCLALAAPAQAQHRVNMPHGPSPVRLFDQAGAGAGALLNKMFSSEHFRMSHSYDMSFGSFGGNSSSMGMYTNSMMWQFNQKLAARVDVSYAFSPFGGGGQNNFFKQGEGGRFFLRNAEVAYRPTENINLNFSIRQSPYGSYMSPYGYYGYGHDYFGYGMQREPLFWRNSARN